MTTDLGRAGVKSPPTLLHLDQPEVTWLIGVVGAKLRKLRRHHASERAARRREMAGVEPYGARRDREKYEIEGAERVLAKLKGGLP